MSLGTMKGKVDERSAHLAAMSSCPYCELLGIEIAVMESGYARLTMPVDEKLLQPYGMVHGGAIASLADTAAGAALLSVSERDVQPVTVDLKLNFISATSQGVLVAEARLLHRGRTTAVADIELRDDDGKLVAKGIATFLALRH